MRCNSVVKVSSGGEKPRFTKNLFNSLKMLKVTDLELKLYNLDGN